MKRIFMLYTIPAYTFVFLVGLAMYEVSNSFLISIPFVYLLARYMSTQAYTAAFHDYLKQCYGKEFAGYDPDTKTLFIRMTANKERAVEHITVSLNFDEPVEEATASS